MLTGCEEEMVYLVGGDREVWLKRTESGLLVVVVVRIVSCAGLVGVAVVAIGGSVPKDTEAVEFLHSTLQLKPCRSPFKKP